MAEYREATPAAERNALEVWEVMLKAEQKTVKAIRAKNFEKYLSVANKNNGDAFFDEVSLLVPLFWNYVNFILNYVNFESECCACHESDQSALLHQHLSGHDD